MGSTTIQQPTPPTPPTQAQTAQDFANSLPIYYNAELQYNPLLAQQQVDLLNQYSPQIGQAELNAQNIMYPGQTQLTNTLTQQANDGIQSGVPQWMQDQYRSNVNAQLGTNVNSPIGADYMSRGLLQQQQDWKQYYQNMGLSISGKQPIYGATAPNSANYVAGNTPSNALNYASNTYGNYAGAYANMYGSNTSYANNNNNLMQKYIGAGLNGAGVLMGG